jgi:cation diffusion facilitator family transporter
MAAKPADRDHPFGHARIEYIASMIVAFLILTVGFEFFSDSLTKVFSPADATEIDVSLTTIIILSVSILLKLWLSVFYKANGRLIGSGVLCAAATDSFFDMISTSAVLVCSIIIKLTHFIIIDAIAGIGLSVMIMVAGIRLLNDTKNSLLGEAPIDETVESIEAVVREYPQVLGIHDMLVHNYGPNRYIASFHAEVDGKGDIFLLHDVIDNVEKTIFERLGIMCTIHMDPLVTDDESLNALKAKVDDAVMSIAEGITVHDFRAVVGATHTNLIFDIVLPFESKLTPEQAIKAIQDRISEKESNCFCVITVDRG